MYRFSLLIALATLALGIVCAVPSGTGAQDQGATAAADKAKVISTPSGEFVGLGYNSKGYREFKRMKDGATVVVIPPGNFKKTVYGGDPLAEQEQFDSPVAGFVIDKYETTNAQAAAFLADQSKLEYEDGKVSTEEGVRLARSHKWGLAISASGARVQDGMDDFPFVGGTGHFAVAYAKWVGGSLPYGYEHEKAGAGPFGQTFPWGEQIPNSTQANFFASGPRRTSLVGAYPAGISPYGVHDLSGNVYERCYWFETDKEIDPQMQPVMLKGGGWTSAHWGNLRNVDRCAEAMDDATGSIGFRCVIRDPETLKALGMGVAPALRIHDTVGKAFEEAAKRNVPIFLFLGYETCGQTDRVRAEVFTDPKFIEYMNEHAVILVGHNTGDGWQDPVESAEGASTLYPGCRAENLQETFSDFVVIVDVDEIPEAIWDFKISPGMFALNPHNALMTKAEHMLLVGEDGFPKGGDGIEKFIESMKTAQKALGAGQSRSDYLAGKEAPKTSWKPPAEKEEDDE